jgi:hypothetical protein
VKKNKAPGQRRRKEKVSEKEISGFDCGFDLCNYCNTSIQGMKHHKETKHDTTLDRAGLIKTQLRGVLSVAILKRSVNDEEDQLVEVDRVSKARKHAIGDSFKRPGLRWTWWGSHMSIILLIIRLQA